MSQPDASQLHQFLVDHFNLDELKTLCFKLGVDFEDLGGDGKTGKARELVLLMQRQSRLEYLYAHLSLTRPEAYRQRFYESPTIPAFPVRLQRNQRQVFISHAKQDAVFAQRLAGDLQARGVPVWIAPNNIRLGEDWPDAIDRGLDESGVFVVALTPDALNSYWVRKETSTARLLAARNQIRFILLDVVESDPPSAWQTYQYASFRQDYDHGLSELLRALEGDESVSRAERVETFRRNFLKTSLPNRRIHEKTGIELIRIPAGSFFYGQNKRIIDLPDYWIGRTPVTNAQYKRFLDANPKYRVPYMQPDWASAFRWNEYHRTFQKGKDNHPVTLVRWDDAKAFCDWAGLDLPTEEQWEKAARGIDGRIWPWGNSPPTDKHCNFGANVGDTTPVSKYSPLGDSPYGCVDMAGNVGEWTESLHNMNSSERIIRGGQWEFPHEYTRADHRYTYQWPDYKPNFVGFRVVELLIDPEL